MDTLPPEVAALILSPLLCRGDRVRARAVCRLRATAVAAWGRVGGDAALAQLYGAKEGDARAALRRLRRAWDTITDAALALSPRPTHRWDVAFRLTFADATHADLYYAMEFVEDAELATLLRLLVTERADAERVVRVSAHRSIARVRCRASPFLLTDVCYVMLRPDVHHAVRWTDARAWEARSVTRASS